MSGPKLPSRGFYWHMENQTSLGVAQSSLDPHVHIDLWLYPPDIDNQILIGYAV